MAYNTKNEVKISVNGVRLANVSRFESKMLRDYTVSGSSVVANFKETEIILCRTLPLNEPMITSIFTTTAFQIKAVYPWYTATYTGCEWVSCSHAVNTDNTVTETLIIKASNCSVGQ